MLNLSKKIAELMQMRGISISKLASKAYMSKTQVHNIISGKNSPRLDTLVLICEALNVNVCDLLRNDSEELPQIALDADRKKIIEYIITASPAQTAALLEVTKAVCDSDNEE